MRPDLLDVPRALLRRVDDGELPRVLARFLTNVRRDDAALDLAYDGGTLILGDQQESREPTPGQVGRRGAEKLNDRSDVIAWRRPDRRVAPARRRQHRGR